MLLQLQRLILNYPEEVTLELFPSQPTGEGEGDDEEGKAFRLAIQALEKFRQQHRARKSIFICFFAICLCVNTTVRLTLTYFQFHAGF